MNKVSLRFFVKSVTENAGGSHTVFLAPDYKDGANSDWSKYTPSGSIQLNLSKEAAVEFYTTALRENKTVAIEMSILP